MDNDIEFVLSSVRRMNVVNFLDNVNMARNSEISDALFLPTSNVTTITNELVDRGILQYTRYKRFKFFQLTIKGKEIAKQIRGYYGFNTK